MVASVYLFLHKGVPIREVLRETQLTRCVVSTPFSLLVQTLMVKKDRKLPVKETLLKDNFRWFGEPETRMGHPIQCVMGALLVVFPHPRCTNFPDLVQGF
jgi:hypothetical protein